LNLHSLNRAALAILLLLVVVVPLPYGSVLRPGELVIEVLGALAAALAVFTSSDLSRLRAAALPLLATTAIALLGAFQLLPLPTSTLKTISPKSAEIYSDASAILEQRGAAPIASARISIAPLETRRVILLTLAYVAIFVASTLLLSSRRRRRSFSTFVLIGAGIQIVIAALTRETGLGGLLRGVGDEQYAGRLRGAFINPNHLAGYLELALAVAFGVLWAEVLTNRRRAGGVANRSEELERRVTPLVARALVWGIVAAAIALTQSRGGVAAMVLTTLILFALGALHPRLALRRRRTLGLAAAVVAGGIMLAAITAQQGSFLRYLAKDPRDAGNDIRVTIWNSSIDAWRNFPTFGSGLGAFPDAFRMVQPRTMNKLVEQAHDELLQMLVTGGWVGAALAAIALGSLFVLLVHAWWKQRHREESAMALAGIGALVSLMLHGIVEFNLSIPAIAATLAAVLGWAWAAANASEDEA